jgi:hypothetical protein
MQRIHQSQELPRARQLGSGIIGQGHAPLDDGLFFLLGDHGVCASANTGSTAVRTTSGGSLSASLKYKPWGGERDSSGTMRTTSRFTGQRAETDLTVPLGYPVTGASTGSGEQGTVVSDVEIRYDWQTSGEFDSNHFTLQKHYRAGAGLVWKVYYGGNVLGERSGRMGKTGKGGQKWG